MASLTEQQSEAVNDALEAVERAVQLCDRAAEVVGRGEGGREVALARTDVQSAENWLERTLRQFG